MALSTLSGDEQRIIFSHLCNVLDPGIAVAFSSASSELWAQTQAPRQQLRASHEAAAALGHKAGKRSCKELREARTFESLISFERRGDLSLLKGLSSDDLALLGKLGSVLPALEELRLHEPTAGPDGMSRLAEQLGAGALPAVTKLCTGGTHLGDAGASLLAAALGRGALARLKILRLNGTGIFDPGLVALAPALRRLPALETLDLRGNKLGDEGLAALVTPPPPAVVAPPTTGVLTKLKELDLGYTQITDAGCATLAAAIDGGVLRALEWLFLKGTPASVAVKATLWRVGLVVVMV